ncbi:hypothetical protein ACQY0O_000497 [Thecaphora frezii]
MPQRSTGAMMFIGERCALDECHREDFLPFKCADCRQHFCGAHFRPASHRCSSLENGPGDYRVPLCPLCDSPPQGWKRDEDPNIAMDRHLSTGNCPALDSQGLIKQDARASSAANAKTPSAASSPRTKKPNECGFKKCFKIMVVPIKCPQCQSSFCPSHRAPTQHSCGSSPSSSTTRLDPPKKLSATGDGSSSAFKKMASSVTKPNLASLGKSTSRSEAPSPDEPKRSPIAAVTGKASSHKLFDKTDKWVPKSVFGLA